jgi:hypothetical protein
MLIFGDERSIVYSSEPPDGAPYLLKTYKQAVKGDNGDLTIHAICRSGPSGDKTEVSELFRYAVACTAVACTGNA